MKGNYIFKIIVCFILSVVSLSFMSCYSTLQTAKTRDGFGLTTGLYKYEVLYH